MTPLASPASTAPTFPEVLRARLATEPARPLLTAYDDATGERTELSVTTYANWVSKTANLLTDELGLDAGDTLLLELPAHWLVPVFLGAAWSAGIAVTTEPEVGHDLVVRGPAGAAAPSQAPVLACALLPFAVRFPDPLPGGALDYGVLWPGQSDVFVPVMPPSPDTRAWTGAPGDGTQAELLEAASLACPAAERLLTDVHPAHERGVPAFLGPLVSGGSLVLLRSPAPESWSARSQDERTTAELRAEGLSQPWSRHRTPGR